MPTHYFEPLPGGGLQEIITYTPAEVAARFAQWTLAHGTGLPHDTTPPEMNHGRFPHENTPRGDAAEKSDGGLQPAENCHTSDARAIAAPSGKIDPSQRFYPCTNAPCADLGSMHGPDGRCQQPGCRCPCCQPGVPRDPWQQQEAREEGHG